MNSALPYPGIDADMAGVTQAVVISACPLSAVVLKDKEEGALGDPSELCLALFWRACP